MGKIDSFTIVFQKSTPIYMGGETLNGALNINVRERLKINSININVIGASRVHWYFYNTINLIIY
jgi:hypothetical protein